MRAVSLITLAAIFPLGASASQAQALEPIPSASVLGGSAAALGLAPQDEMPGTESGAPTVQRKRDWLMEVNFRGRFLGIPDSLLDIWYFDEDDGGYEGKRPKVRAWGVGLEYVVKRDAANGIFYFDYLGSLIQEGYWDDVEKPAIHTDGDWIKPEKLGIIDFGANYGHELKATDWLGFMFGGGLGMLIMTGELTQWSPGSTSEGDPTCSEGLLEAWEASDAPAYERYEAGCGDDGAKRVPKVLPIVDLNISVRFNFNDRANMRLEGGFHDMFYFGGATGIVF